MIKIFEKIVAFLKQKMCCGICSVSTEDPLTNKLFKHYKNKKLYRYLFTATSKEMHEKLVVVYQDIISEKTYTRPLNEFFDCVGTSNNRIARFKEQP